MEALCCVLFFVSLCLLGMLAGARKTCGALRGELAASAAAWREEHQRRLRSGMVIDDLERQLLEAEDWREAVQRADSDGAVQRAVSALLAERRRQTDAGAS